MNLHNHLTSHVNIPLHCNICPKKPNFSDISHLLTHVASKGHLSNYYRMKVKASTDTATKRTVDRYDQWYASWNVEDLMAERMHSKEKKRSGTNSHSNSTSRRASRAPSATHSHGHSHRNTPVVVNLAPHRSLRESTLDPQLGIRVKMEPDSRTASPALGLTLDPAALHRAYAPPMQSWPATPYGNSPPSHETTALTSLYSTPSSDSADIPVQRQIDGHNGRRSMSDSTRSFLVEEDLEFDDGLNENTKLKGVLWDGMGMFDSATPDMRRRRNQKKAVSVVEQLKTTSETVEPTECVYDADGQLRRERPITGIPESDDEGRLQGETTPEPEAHPKKKAGRKAKARPRPALVEKDTNSGRILRRTRQDSAQPALGRRSRHTSYFDGQDDDDELTYQASRPKRRAGLSIHRDNSGPEITFSQPASLNTLTSDFRHPYHLSANAASQSGYNSGFFSEEQQRQQLFSYNAGFRPANSNPLGGIPTPNFGSFGQLNGQSMYQHAHFQSSNPFGLNNAPQAFPGFQPQFGIGQAPYGNDSHVLQPQGQVFTGGQVTDQSGWDVFGLGHPDIGISAANGLPTSGGDFGSVNPLFFSSNQPAPEDDEATVSPPSEH